MDSWTKVRIEIAGRSAKLYLNGSVKPSLVVDGLKGEDLHGGGVFFQPADCASRAAELENGSDVAGSWEMRYSNDVSGMEASMVHRDGSLVVESRRIGVVGDRDAGKVHAELLVIRVLDGNPLRMVHAGGVAEDGIHDAEDCGVGSDAHSKGNDSGQGEAGNPDQLP
jgi:hypothetical protein